ncbi:MAG TPA: MobQ family relaxase [Alphaproteobacteria bacterium]|nr:MobQ family relaxase [Alphaproteobacteria bacterium]
MAIYHCSLRVFSRAENHSAVAAAAYRSGQKLVDERTGTIHRYEKRHGVVKAFILMPEIAPDRYRDRFALWNAAEEIETRKNSRVAREVIIALPYELNTLERESLTRDMAAYLVEKYRVAVDIAIHSPCEGDGHDPRNHHAHLLFTTRELTPEGLGAKTRILDDKITGPQQIEIIREVWETLANDALKRAGRSDVTIDRRTLEAQGIERIPQIHEGKASTYAEELNRASRETEETEDEDDTGTEDGDEGKTEGKKSGSGDQGRLSPDMSPKENTGIDRLTSEDKTDSRKDPFGREKTRAEFNAEIKALNKERAEYPDKPLNDQIKEIEQEIDHLDRRVERLETLLDKTSLPQKLQKLIGDIAAKAKEFLSIRTEDQIKRALSESEKEERHERQIARYGRIYRESIHSQIAEMKNKIETLQSRETEYKKYRSFVTMIETEVMKLRATQTHALNTPQKPDIGTPLTAPAAKAIEHTKAPSKVDGQIQETKGKVPEEYKPSPRTETLQTSFDKAQPDKQPRASNRRDASVQEKATPSITQTIPSEAERATTRPAEEKSHTSSLQERQTTTKITGVKISAPVEQRTDPKNYKIEANAQTKQMLDKIQTELKAQKNQEALQKQEQSQTTEKVDGLKGKFRKLESPPIKEEDFLRKTKAEAERKRQDIPPEYRAPPYTEAELHPKLQPEPKTAHPPQDEGVLDKFKKMWKQETSKPQSNPDQPKQQAKSRKPMSSPFNQAACKPKMDGFDHDVQSKPEKNI